ncbi:hypothetical protein [Streptomyces alanosinicus]|uniref:XRE family transcriptional regulator n=1 Tax=Streptomyces alanosinicus TaxID=68171 RepID=A0A918YTM2_9ACTN|nr:hypothetical protein [Streptomyces alanosinicus]GHE14759.1 hypothetical protein GCM10010339_86940 [Streptomyces alanosinicus]
MGSPLQGTLERVNRCIEEQNLSRADLLDPGSLAVRSALPESTVVALLRGEDVAAGTIEERVTTRIKTLAFARHRGDKARLADLADEMVNTLGLSAPWARSVLKGDKMPDVRLLHDLADFFDVDGGEEFFTGTPEESLDRVLVPILERWEKPHSQDPTLELMKRYGIVGTDLRRHGTMTPEQLDRLIRGALKPLASEEDEQS